MTTGSRLWVLIVAFEIAVPTRVMANTVYLHCVGVQASGIFVHYPNMPAYNLRERLALDLDGRKVDWNNYAVERTDPISINPASITWIANYPTVCPAQDYLVLERSTLTLRWQNYVGGGGCYAFQTAISNAIFSCSKIPAPPDLLLGSPVQAPGRALSGAATRRGAPARAIRRGPARRARGRARRASAAG